MQYQFRVRTLAFAGAAAGALSALGVIGGTLAYAQTGTDGSTPAAAAQQASPADHAGAFIDLLAQNLGIDAGSLRSALRQTSIDTIDQAEAGGAITSERAAALRQRLEDGGDVFVPPFFGPAGHHGGPGGPGMGRGAGMPGADKTALAGFLGITEEQLRSEMMAGLSLATVAENHGKSRDELKSFLTSIEEQEVSDAVAAGRLTQAEGDEHLQRSLANMDDRIDAVPGAGGHGGHVFDGPPPSGDAS